MRNIDLLRSVAGDLARLGVECVFFGGTVVGLHLDAVPFGDEERPTTDVDCVPITVSSTHEMQVLEARLDRAGWQHDLSGPKRNAFARVSPSGVPVDFVPLHSLDDDDPLRHARRVDVRLDSDLQLRTLSATGMVATKLAAFFDRGHNDPLMSHDLEDLAMLLACCSTLESDLRKEPHGVRQRIKIGLSNILRDPFVLEILEGSIPTGVDSLRVLKRLEALIQQA